MRVHACDVPALPFSTIEAEQDKRIILSCTMNLDYSPLKAVVYVELML